MAPITENWGFMEYDYSTEVFPLCSSYEISMIYVVLASLLAYEEFSHIYLLHS